MVADWMHDTHAPQWAVLGSAERCPRFPTSGAGRVLHPKVSCVPRGLATVPDDGVESPPGTVVGFTMSGAVSWSAWPCPATPVRRLAILTSGANFLRVGFRT
jgi:hypothetical protein